MKRAEKIWTPKSLPFHLPLVLVLLLVPVYVLTLCSLLSTEHVPLIVSCQINERVFVALLDPLAFNSLDRFLDRPYSNPPPVRTDSLGPLVGKLQQERSVGPSVHSSCSNQQRDGDGHCPSVGSLEILWSLTVSFESVPAFIVTVEAYGG
ncbi:hypothetical protein Tsp_05089 [Trichinella spiralis]|uniref:hypothetical protein n=1 Tax=Trichinella spiralis TaxID=6334 RepID=UPI0001EFED0E|nr:hypothetical protein Tsp_05089 [Trichinella spiralis]